MIDAVMDVKTVASREQKDKMANSLITPYFDGDPFYCEEFIESTRAFVKQAGAGELAFQKVCSQIKIRYGKAALRKAMQECNGMEEFFDLLKQCVYDPVYVRRWFLFGLNRQKRCRPMKRFCARIARQFLKT